MVRYRWNRPRRKPEPATDHEEDLELETEQANLIEDLTFGLPHKLKTNVGRQQTTETSSVGTQTDLEFMPDESRRPRSPSAQRSPPLIRNRCFRSLLPAPIPLYPIALGLPRCQTSPGLRSHQAEKNEAASSDSATSLFSVPVERVVYSVSKNHSSSRDAVDAEIVDILQSPAVLDSDEMLCMYDRLVNATQDGRSCYMSSTGSRCPFFIGNVPFGYKSPDSMKKLKQASTKAKIFSWLLRSPDRKLSN